MARFIYTVTDTVKSGTPSASSICNRKHADADELFYELPPAVTEPDVARQYMEDKVLSRYSGETVRLFLECEEWVPTTHKRKVTPQALPPRKQ